MFMLTILIRPRCLKIECLYLFGCHSDAYEAHSTIQFAVKGETYCQNQCERRTVRWMLQQNIQFQNKSIQYTRF